MTTTLATIILFLFPNVEAHLYNIDNLLFIEVTVNDKPACFVVDSGSPVTILDSRQAKRYGFRAVGREMPVKGLCNSHSWRAATEATISIEGRKVFPKLATADLICMEKQFSRRLPAPLLGIIGNDVLKEYKAEFDIKGNALTLFFNDKKPMEEGLVAEAQK